jgi:adenylate cyclase
MIEPTRQDEPATGPDAVGGDLVATDPGETDHWRSLLTGEDPSLRRLRGAWRRVPHGPRCKVCSAPFAGVGGAATRLILHGRAIANPTMCTTCFKSLASHPGGTDLDISVLFADVRGSTALAEQIGPVAFRAALQTFYGLAAAAIEGQGGFVDKYLGDGVMAQFIPILAGEAHVDRAITAALELTSAVERSSLPAAGFRVGAGVQCGTAFVGVLGSGQTFDFSALGDPVNVAARLGSIAGPGEVMVSREAWQAAGRSDGGEERTVEIAGRHEPLDVVVIPASSGGAGG